MERRRNERIHREYSSGVRIVEESDEYGRRFKFEAPTHVGREFETPDLAELYADVYFDVNSFREEKSGERGVPPEIAAAGKDTLAAYLVTNPGMSVTWVSRFMDVGEDTVRTYLSRVRRRAEQRREEIEEEARADDRRDGAVDVDGEDLTDHGAVDVDQDDDVLEEPPDDVDAIIDELDLPGSGPTLEERRDAVRACWRYLREQVEATKSDFVDDVYPDHSARYGSAGGWWNAVGKQGLRSVADEHESVDAPIEGNHVWVFVSDDG